MTISLTCLCGKVLIADARLAGQTAACPACGYVNAIPAPLAADTLAKEPPTVIPVEESPEDEIPEVEVEEHVPVWEVKKPPPRDPVDDAPRQQAGTPSPEGDDDSAGFAGKLSAAAALGWGMAGALRLPRPATCLAYGPGGAWGLVDQADDVLILNMRKGKKIDRFCRHDAPVTCVALSPEGTFALSGDEAGDVIRWELADHKRRIKLEEHESLITALALSPDGDLSASGDRRGEIIVWNLRKDTMRALDGGGWAEKVTELAFSPDGKSIAAGGSNGRVEVWSVKTGRRLQRCRFGDQPIASLRFNFKGDSILAAVRPQIKDAARHPKVYRLAVATGDCEECFTPADRPTLIPHCAILDHGAKRLLIAGPSTQVAATFLKGDSCLEVWSLASARRLHVFPDVRGDVLRLAITPANNRVAALLTKPLLQVFTLPVAV